MIYTNSDGGSRGNPGPGAIGVIVREGEKILTKYQGTVGRRVTNNVAEYEGLIKAMELASKFTNKQVTCIVDSELIVKQLLGEYRVKNRRLLGLFRKVQQLQERFEKIAYKHAPREDKYQKIVDGMLNEVLDREFPYTYKKNRYK
ncbi:MAG TPA: ribonuclease HI family protein [Candidatus Nanoarchaeia archaeon]|nr:ribonuclease HI family protein [Candidatus Nanoarchaeia archaeon]